MGWSKIGHEKYRTDKTCDKLRCGGGGGAGGSSTQLLERQPLLATNFNSAVFIHLAHRNSRICNCRWWWNDSTDSGYIMQNIEPDKSGGERKPGMTSRTRSANPQKFGFRCLESGKEVHAAGLPNFVLWKSLLVCHSLRWFKKKKKISRPSTCSDPAAKLAVITHL